MKGQSGNPSGGSQLLHEVRSRCLELIRRRGFDDLEQLLADRDSMVRLAALKLLFEYGLGKPAVLPESAWAPDPDEGVQQQARQVDAAEVWARENPPTSDAPRRTSLWALGHADLIACPNCGGPATITKPPED